MKAYQDSGSKFDRLRRQAEELIRNRADFNIAPFCDILELIHECKIHQAELVIQNEELKRAQQELSQLHREYERLYEFAPCGYLTLNAKGIITQINLTGVKLLGVPKIFLLRSGLNHYIAEGWQDAYLTARKTAAQKGESQSVELQLKRENAASLWLRADIRADRDKDDTIIQWFVVLTDITREKEAVAALALNEERFRTLFENTPIAYQSLDADGNILQVNTAWEEMLGYVKKEVIGKSFSEFILPEERDRLNKQFITHRSLGKILGPEFVLFKKGGDRILVAHTEKANLDNRCGTTQIHCLLQDITYKRKVEQERQQLEDRLHHAQKMETIGTLAGGVAHDFNNILTIIIGNYELIKNELPEWSPVRENLEQIHSASLRARDVVTQLLTVARKGDIKQTPLDIAAVVKESFNLIRSTIPANIEILQQVPDGTGPILGNSTQMNQLIINLCTNAADAMLPEGGRLTVGLENVLLDEAGALLTNTLKPGPHIKLVIQDTGRGMDVKTLAHIFEPYFTTKPFGKGTGIGLAVVHGIVDQHKGEIFVESKPGKGSTFTILLPAFHGQVEEKEIDDVSLPRGNEKILFVDDEEPIVKLTQSRLSFLGYSVTCTTNPLKALEMVKADPSAFDLVVTDMAMPNITGDALSSEILSLCPDLPIILCTGYSENINEESARKIGIAGFLMKPVVMADFASTVRKALDMAKKKDKKIFK
jgi:PAS domain S-box-containing protein